jgi:hypothetical protein
VSTQKAAAPFERRLARAFLRAAERVRAKASINEIALVIAGRNLRDFDALWRSLGFEEALQPTAGIVRDAFTKGGRLGAVQVNEATH